MSSTAEAPVSTTASVDTASSTASSSKPQQARHLKDAMKHASLNKKALKTLCTTRPWTPSTQRASMDTNACYRHVLGHRTCRSSSWRRTVIKSKFFALMLLRSILERNPHAGTMNSHISVGFASVWSTPNGSCPGTTRRETDATSTTTSLHARIPRPACKSHHKISSKLRCRSNDKHWKILSRRTRKKPGRGRRTQDNTRGRSHGLKRSLCNLKKIGTRPNKRKQSKSKKSLNDLQML